MFVLNQSFLVTSYYLVFSAHNPANLALLENFNKQTLNSFLLPNTLLSVDSGFWKVNDVFEHVDGECSVSVRTCTHKFPGMRLSHELPVIAARTLVSIKERFILVYTKSGDNDMPSGFPELMRCYRPFSAVVGLLRDFC